MSFKLLGRRPEHEHHREGEAERAGLPCCHRVPGVRHRQAGRQDHPQHVSCEANVEGFLKTLKKDFLSRHKLVMF